MDDVSLPPLPNALSSDLPKIRKELKNLYLESRTRFEDFFRLEYPLPLRFERCFAASLDSGIIRRNGDSLRSAFRIWPLQIRGDVYFVLTDLYTQRNFHRVFPIYPDESDVLARHIRICRGQRVLDLGTGSGIYSIVAAARGGNVLATDINPRCVDMTRLNALLNGLSSVVEAAQSDLFTGIPRQKFDTIICNPPYGLRPKPVFLHGDGGIDGMQLTRKIVQNLPRYVAKNGRFQFLVSSVGLGGRLAVVDLMDQAFQAADCPLTLKVTHILKPIPLAQYLERFPSSEHHAWREDLIRRYDTYAHVLLDGLVGKKNPARIRQLRLRFSLNICEQPDVPPMRLRRKLYKTRWEYRFARVQPLPSERPKPREISIALSFSKT